MMKVLVVFEQIDNTVEVNLTAIETIFNLDGFAVRYSLSRKVTEIDLNWCDICYAIRPSSIYTVEIALAITESKRIFISLFDDDLLNLPSSHSSFWRKNYMLKCLRMSKAVITCNYLLIEDYQKIVPNPKYILSHAFVLEKEIKKHADYGETIKMVYVAGRDHTELFESLIMPSLEKLMSVYRNVEVHIMGIEPDLSNFPYQERIIKHAARSLEEYKLFMRKHNFCIGFAPLHNNSFSNRKYFIKYLDYARFGIAGVYSSCMPYTQVVKDGENGLLVKNTTDNWVLAIDRLIKNVELRKVIIENSQKHIRSKFSLEAVRTHLFNNLQPLFDNKPLKKELYLKSNIIGHLIYDQRSNYHRLKSYIGAYGIKKTINRLLL